VANIELQTVRKVILKLVVKDKGPLYAGELKLLEGERKEFECPNFDFDDVHELSHSLFLKTDFLFLSLNNNFTDR
jgi:hypothetical protein